MSQGPHDHDWVFNPVEVETDMRTAEKHYSALRFCKHCRFIERLEFTQEL